MPVPRPELRQPAASAGRVSHCSSGAKAERGMIRQRVHAGLARARAEGKRLGRPSISAAAEATIREKLATGAGINKVARELGMANGTVHKVKRAMVQAAGSTHA